MVNPNPIVITGDRSCANRDLIGNYRVPDERMMINSTTGPNLRVLDFHVIADLNPISDGIPWANPAVGPNETIGAAIIKLKVAAIEP